MAVGLEVFDLTFFAQSFHFAGLLLTLARAESYDRLSSPRQVDNAPLGARVRQAGRRSVDRNLR